MHCQLTALSADLAGREQRLYLDLPVGTSGDGFDTWSHHDLFGWGCGVGAPPDDFFGAGQNWGFPPVSPMISRAQGHAHLAACLRHHLTAARVLRLDHVMGLERLYWVPDGHAASEGVYVRYPRDELFAVLAVEATRADAVVVGEDLGTVPDEVRDALQRHGILGMYVSQFELPSHPGAPIPVPDRFQVATLDTHDTPTFAAWWQGLDVDLRQRLGFLDEAEAEADRNRRATDRRAVELALREAGLLPGDADEGAARDGVLRLLGRSDAASVLVALDDLVLETDPQNVPGTGQDRPNWVRMLPCTLAELTDDPAIQATLAGLQDERLGAHARAQEDIR